MSAPEEDRFHSFCLFLLLVASPLLDCFLAETSSTSQSRLVSPWFLTLEPRNTTISEQEADGLSFLLIVCLLLLFEFFFEVNTHSDDDFLTTCKIYPRRTFQPPIKLRRRYIMQLETSSSPLTQKIFKDLQNQLIEPWPFFVRISSVSLIHNADGITSMVITKKFVGNTLQEMYADYSSLGSRIPVDVSFVNSRSHFFFSPLRLIYFSSIETLADMCSIVVGHPCFNSWKSSS
jgi:hypothetical protein